ncbi:bacteriocin-like protein [Mucilaginibacter sp.]|uniref:bacteriocin-like protein n=1 Tax=Mucilaginibacter sp. TaxID=1882438 RepID=UPI0039C8EEA1
MKNFKRLNRDQMRVIKGGVTTGSCSASCGDNKTVTCTGTDCYAQDGTGCNAVTSAGTADSHSCADL